MITKGALIALVVGLFVAGIAWRATHTDQTSTLPNDEQQIRSRQDGYYLCLKLPKLTDRERRNLIRSKYPHDDQEWALRGCQEAQG